MQSEWKLKHLGPWLELSLGDPNDSSGCGPDVDCRPLRGLAAGSCAVSICMHIHMYVCVYLCICTYIYVCNMCMRVYVYTYTHIST